MMAFGFPVGAGVTMVSLGIVRNQPGQTKQYAQSHNAEIEIICIEQTISFQAFCTQYYFDI